MSKGSNYREPASISKRKVKKVMDKSIRDFIIKLSLKYNVNIEEFDNWASKLGFMISKHTRKYNKWIGRDSLLIKSMVKEHLNELHRKYIVVPADKDAGNSVVICKKILHECPKSRVRLKDFKFTGNDAYKIMMSLLPTRGYTEGTIQMNRVLQGFYNKMRTKPNDNINSFQQ